jgi:alternate signal-mediated exported protein
MNSKLIKASLAGAAALVVAGGGTTFSAWSDFATDTGNKVGADVLALTVNPSASRQFNDVTLAPGEARDLAFYVASRNGVAVPKAGLKMTIQNLVGTENGCDSNSEASDESAGAITDKADLTAPCNVAGGAGQFLQQAAFYVQADKVTSAAQCNGSYANSTVLSNKVLGSMNNIPVSLLDTGVTLAGGEGVCVLAHVFLPKTAGEVVGVTPTNASQGDKASFDVRFDLSQI